jgi:S-adenosylmethionine hydrolase
MANPPIVCMVTDFGNADSYVGEMKGVILGICPGARIVDLTHKIKKYDVAQACYTLARSHLYFPAGTVFLAVVDPGVGGSRRGLAAKGGGKYFVGPDNGIFSFLMRDAETAFHHLAETKYFLGSISSTFHGRDIFAPVAAHLAHGVAVEDLGPKIEDPIPLPDIRPVRDKGHLLGKIIHVDDFGNLISNITAGDIRDSFGSKAVSIILGEGDRIIEGIKGCYEDVEKGEALALFGSGPFLEIAVREGRAEQILGNAAGSRLLLKVKS